MAVKGMRGCGAGVLICAIAVAGLPHLAGADEGFQLPNLVPHAPSGIDIGERDGGGGSALRFATTIANRGGYALDMLTMADDPTKPLDEQTGEAMQCVQWIARVCAARESVGRIGWEPGHGHFHLMDFARFELRTLTPDGVPDQSEAGLVAGGQKISFCLEDSEPDSSFQVRPEHVPMYEECSLVIQGISPGWADVYQSGQVGQQILIDDVPDGRYALVVYANPIGQVLETSREDDMAYTVITLSDDGTEVRS